MTARADSPATSPLIELVNAAIAPAHSPATPLVRNVNWRLHAGDFWVIGGLHWAGKTDWLMTVAGLQRPAAGEHRLFGAATESLAQPDLIAARRRVGLVFEHGGRLFPRLTVAENLALPLCYHENCAGEDVSEWVAALLDFTGTTELAAQPAGALNRSWQQRVALARALGLRPEVLLLDNPLAGLDPRQSRWWQDALAALNAGRAPLAPLAVVVTTDDLRGWRAPQRRFGWLADSRWQDLGDDATASKTLNALEFFPD